MDKLNYVHTLYKNTKLIIQEYYEVIKLNKFK